MAWPMSAVLPHAPAFGDASWLPLTHVRHGPAIETARRFSARAFAQLVRFVQPNRAIVRVISVTVVLGSERRVRVTDWGDSNAASFDSFFRASQKPLVAMAYLLTGNQSTAQDLAQEAFLRTWSRWPKVRKYDDPLAWTRRVLYNLAVSKTRADKVRMKPLDPPVPFPPPDATHLILAAALRSLPEQQMRALVLHDGAGMSVHDVAVQMRAREGTVKSWLSRGRSSAAAYLNSTEIPKEAHARQ